MDGERNASGGPDPIVNAERVREAVAEGVIVLEVRGPNEYEAGHVDGAIHVPLGSLLEGLDRLLKGTLLRVW